MALVATLIEQDGRRVAGLDDPSGGTFDAAGDLDRLLGRSDVDLAVLGRVDTDGVTALEREDMGGLIADIDCLMAAGTLQPEEIRGLRRLRLMAQECAKGRDLQVVFMGD